MCIACPHVAHTCMYILIHVCNMKCVHMYMYMYVPRFGQLGVGHERGVFSYAYIHIKVHVHVCCLPGFLLFSCTLYLHDIVCLFSMIWLFVCLAWVGRVGFLSLLLNSVHVYIYMLYMYMYVCRYMAGTCAHNSNMHIIIPSMCMHTIVINGNGNLQVSNSY